MIDLYPNTCHITYTDNLRSCYALYTYGQCVYCSMSFNSAPSVTRYQLAEILISAGPRFDLSNWILLEISI